MLIISALGDEQNQYKNKGNHYLNQKGLKKKYIYTKPVSHF